MITPDPHPWTVPIAIAGGFPSLPPYPPSGPSPPVERRPNRPSSFSVPLLPADRIGSPGAPPSGVRLTRERRPCVRVSSDVAAEVVRRVRAGVPRREIAIAFEMAESTVSRLMAKASASG